MFFRRQKPREITFDERLQAIRDAGFQVERLPDGGIRVSRGDCAAVVRETPQGVLVDRAGWVIDRQTALLVDGGFQKFWRVGEERKAPALAHQLKTLHDFEEDLREALGLTSLYNTSLGTVNDLHLYDRVQGRETDGNRRLWQRD